MHLIQLLIRCLWCFVCLCLSSLSVRLLSWTTTGCTSDRTVRLVALELSPSLHWPYAWWSWVTIMNSYAGVSGDHPRRSRQFQWWWPPRTWRRVSGCDQKQCYSLLTNRINLGSRKMACRTFAEPQVAWPAGNIPSTCGQSDRWSDVTLRRKHLPTF